MADEAADLIRKEVLPQMRALHARLDATEARLSAMEARGSGSPLPSAWEMAASAHAAEEARISGAAPRAGTSQSPTAPETRTAASEGSDGLSPAERIVVPEAQLDRERRWSWTVVGMMAFAIALGVFLASRGGKSLYGGDDYSNSGSAKEKSAATISGTISVAPALKKQAKRGMLFVIARQGDGPPLAVRRFENPSFPIKFSLSQEDVMMTGMAFAGQVFVTARLSRSGNAKAGAGDLGGAFSKNPLSVGDQSVDIVLDREH